MGVHGLWRLLDTFGQVTQPETWRGRRVAIDASIWIAQFRAQAKPDSDVEQQILEGFFARVLKLLFYGIHAVFVFDGPATSAKSTEHRRRQLRRQALSQALLKRRARQILTAQVSAGVLDVAHLPCTVGDAGAKAEVTPVAPTTEAPVSSGERQTKSAVNALDARESAELGTAHHRRGRRRVPSRHCLAPEKVSRTVTRVFLRDADELLTARRRGERLVVENQLRETPSLFMGPRRAFEGAASTTTPAPRVEERVVDVESSHSEGEAECSGDDAVLSVSSSAVEVDSGGASSDGSVTSVTDIGAGPRERSVQVMDLTTMTPPCSQKGATTTPHPLAFLLNTRTPPLKLPRLGSDRAEGSDGGSAQHESSADALSTASSELVFHTEDTDDSGSDGELSETEDSDEDASSGHAAHEGFLWHPNSQLGPSSEVQAPADPSAPNESYPTASQGSEGEFVPVPWRPTTAAAAATVGGPSAPLSISFPLPAGAVGRQVGGTAAPSARPIPFELLRLVELLDCCGVDVVLSPAEADAQCAWLAREGLVDAVFTEDSDVVVHGAPVVLRGFFASHRHAVAYRGADLAACGVDKDVLVALAYLLGCDYTEGVSGLGLAGALNAIIAAWPSPAAEGGPTQVGGSTATAPATGEAARREAEEVGGPAFVAALLQRWHRLVMDTTTTAATSWMDGLGNGAEERSLLQHHVLSACRSLWATLAPPEGFPDPAVAAAFFTPAVDDADRAPFPPMRPDWARVRAYAGSHGLLGSDWVRQRYELARKAWEAHEAALARSGVGVDTEGRRQHRLDEFVVRTPRVAERWVYKMAPPQLAGALAQLRAVRAAAGGCRPSP